MTEHSPEPQRVYRLPSAMDLTTAQQNIIRRETGVDVTEPITNAAGICALLWWVAQDAYTWAQLVDMPMGKLQDLIKDEQPEPDPASIPPVVPDPSGVEPVADPSACDWCGHPRRNHQADETAHPAWCGNCQCPDYEPPRNPFEGEPDPTPGSATPEP